MAESIRTYFDRKVPVAPGEGRPPAPPQQRQTWQQAWNQLSRSVFVTLPNQLDRTRVNRNRFLKAVK